MRLLIDNKNDLDRAYLLPWGSSQPDFNFRVPEKCILPENITKEIKRPSYVTTLVIDCPLDDYGFIRRMKNLQQLYIYDGETLDDISFLEGLTKLRQLCILGSHISSLDSIKKLILAKDELYKVGIEECPGPFEETRIRFMYGFEAICITTDACDSDPSELLYDNICRSDIRINRKHIM